MSILGTIFSKIFPSSHAAPAPAAPSAAAPAPMAPGAATPMPVSISEVDVEQILNGLVAKSPEKLNWKSSIVDLMKLLGLDSSLTARKQLAEELQYTGNTDDSASMNIWLHRQVMNKLAANGGKVPAELKD